MHPLEFPQKILFWNTSEAPLGWLLPWVLRGAQFTCGNPRGEATELRIKRTKKNHFLSSDAADRDGWWVTSRSCCLRASRKGSLKGFSPVESMLFFKKIFFVLFFTLLHFRCGIQMRWLGTTAAILRPWGNGQGTCRDGPSLSCWVSTYSHLSPDILLDERDQPVCI